MIVSDLKAPETEAFYFSTKHIKPGVAAPSPRGGCDASGGCVAPAWLSL